MSGPIDVAIRFASNTARVGWFYGINRLIADRLVPTDKQVGSKPSRPVPSRSEMFSDLRQLLLEDAADASKGVNPGVELQPTRISRHVGRLRDMLRDLPSTAERRAQGVIDTAKAHADVVDGEPLPDYYAQDFHFQTGGHLTDDAARIYDVQVETLFYGTGDAMRRAAFRPLAEEMRGRDQRQVALLDIACGTGRFIRDVRRSYPRMTLAGLDLSPPYLVEAKRHLGALRAVEWHQANAEAMPLEDASQDIVTSIFLFHELPPAVRARVASEIARVLRPGGLFLMVDSLQYGDKPGWDGLLEAFPERFHEPYYRHYLIDDLEQTFGDAGMVLQSTRAAFLSKVMTLRRV